MHLSANMEPDRRGKGSQAAPCTGLLGKHATLYALSLSISYCLVPSPAWPDGLGYENQPPQELCGLCHGLNGISATSKFPKLAGQKKAYIEKQLKDFLAGNRSNDGGQMASIVTEIPPEKFKDVATYFSGLEPPPPADENEAALSDDEKAHARRLVEDGRPEKGIPACASCHLETNSALPYAPRLTAQHRNYLQKQLNDFREKNRDNDTTGTMQKIAAALDKSEITILAAYLAATPRARSHP